MQKKKMIMDIIGKEIKKYGFTYGVEKAYSGTHTWGFSREIQGIIQRISLQEHRFMKAFFLGFSTSAWGQSMDKRAGTKIQLPADYSNQHDKWYYETEEDFKNMLIEFLDIIENHGLKELEAMSIEPEVIPTNEMGEKLISSVKELSTQFIQDNQIVNFEMSEGNISKWFELIEAKFKATKDFSYNDVKDMLLEVIAFLGEQLRQELQGEWRMGIESRIIILEILKTHPYSGYFPLKAIVEAWSKNDISDFKEQYLTFLKNKV